MSPAEQLLARLWDRYAEDVEYARTFVALAGRLVNDHVAFRSLARSPGDGIAPFRALFEGLGWRAAGSYAFPETHVDAIYLSHPDGLPRVFLSELRTRDLSEPARAILDRTVLPTSDPASPDWFAPPTRLPDAVALDALDAESQYGAWVALFGRTVNHFTASVDDVEAWQARLSGAGVPMKAVIEGAPDSPLRQTATAAWRLRVTLADGSVREWPYAYLEIAQRAPGFDGFLGPQARQLFEMTRRG